MRLNKVEKGQMGVYVEFDYLKNLKTASSIEEELDLLATGDVPIVVRGDVYDLVVSSDDYEAYLESALEAFRQEEAKQEEARKVEEAKQVAKQAEQEKAEQEEVAEEEVVEEDKQVEEAAEEGRAQDDVQDKPVEDSSDNSIEEVEEAVSQEKDSSFYEVSAKLLRYEDALDRLLNQYKELEKERDELEDAMPIFANNLAAEAFVDYGKVKEAVDYILRSEFSRFIDNKEDLLYFFAVRGLLGDQVAQKSFAIQDEDYKEVLEAVEWFLPVSVYEYEDALDKVDETDDKEVSENLVEKDVSE